MRLFSLFLLSFFICLVGYANGPKAPKGGYKMYRIIDTVPIKKAKPKKVTKFAKKWMSSQKNIRMVRYNKKLGVAEGKGFFEYYNKVVMEDVFLSPRVAERTNGTISYKIRFVCADSVAYVQYYNFEHVAYNSQYGPLSFGLISFYDAPPPNVCEEASVWCRAVYSDMKKMAVQVIDERKEDIFPNSFIRKKAFKVKEEEEEEVVEEVDPLDYLKIEHYIKKYEELEGEESSEHVDKKQKKAAKTQTEVKKTDKKSIKAEKKKRKKKDR